MNESMRTAIYVGAAVLSLAVATLSNSSVARSPREFSQVGKEFFPEFTDANAAKSLQVIQYNPDTAAIRMFGVEQGADGIWRVPSRNNYPVDGKERLGKTAASVIGIKRDQLAGPRKNQHVEFGVLDPLSENVSDFKGVGNRLTLKDGKEGKVLADLIIGKEVKSRPGYYYVRNPKEEQTYIAKVSVDVSTKFADWIEPDLLKLDASKLRSIVIDKHSIEISPEGGGRVVGEETNKLTRANSTDKWVLEGLDTATEEVNEDEIRKLTQALDDLKITGVRPKSDRLKKRLQDDKGITADKATQIELQDMGYFLARSKDGRSFRMISQEGDVVAGTDQGVVYDLHFGAVFTGSEEEVEAGFIKKEDEAKPEGEAKKEGEAEKKEEDKPNSKKIKSRYLFVQAQFDPEAIGPKPEAPAKPEEPKADEKAGDATADATVAENAPDKVDPQKAYEAALAKYNADNKKYEDDLKAYEEKLKTGEKQVKDLNRRFAEWYYVISGDSFEDLRQGRKTLVKEKAAEGEKPEEASAPPLQN